MRKTFIAAVISIALASVAEAKVFDLFNSQTVYWENDNFGIGRKSDRFYTNGVKVTLGLTPNEWPELSARGERFRIAFCKKTPLCSASQQFESMSIVFGQNFYTPENITIAAPQPNDRPWAGWLYIGLAEAMVDAPQKVQNSFEVQLGILGPGAGAGATQTYIHKDLGFSNHIPAGWHNQLKNEPTLNVMYKHARRYGNDTRDIVPEAGIALGTVQTFASAGVTARVGWHINGFPVTPIPFAAAPVVKPHRFEIYVFAGGEGRYVPFNATLDGGLFRDGPEANGPKRFVTDVRGGVSARVGWLRLTYQVVNRSKEFDVPPGRIESQRFGSFALTIEPFDQFR